jgi:hypothetical protein
MFGTLVREIPSATVRTRSSATAGITLGWDYPVPQITVDVDALRDFDARCWLLCIDPAECESPSLLRIQFAIRIFPHTKNCVLLTDAARALDQLADQSALWPQGKVGGSYDDDWHYP